MRETLYIPYMYIYMKYILCNIVERAKKSKTRQFYSSYVANKTIGCKILKMGYMSNFLQIFLKRNQRGSFLVFNKHKGSLSDSVQIAFPFILLIRGHF